MRDHYRSSMSYKPAILSTTIKILLISLCWIYSTSCTLFKPLSLNPVNNIDSVKKMETPDLPELNGDYEIQSVDSNYCTLDNALLYSRMFDLKSKRTKNAYVRIATIDDKHIKATLFVDGKEVKARKIKGRLVNNYFEFHTTHLKFRFIINVYEQQSNRLALAKSGGLYLDNNHGGIAFLLILPIPLSGAARDTYNLRFTRRN